MLGSLKSGRRTAYRYIIITLSSSVVSEEAALQAAAKSLKIAVVNNPTVQGHPRSLTLAPIERAYMRLLMLLLMTNAPYMVNKDFHIYAAMILV